MASKVVTVTASGTVTTATYSGGAFVTGDTLVVNTGVELRIAAGESLDIGDYTETAGNPVLTINGRVRLAGGALTVRGIVNLQGSSTFTSPSQGTTVGNGTFEWTSGTLTCDHGTTNLDHPWNIMTSAVTGGTARVDFLGPTIPSTGPTATEFASYLQLTVTGTGRSWCKSGTGTATANCVSGGGTVKWRGVAVTGSWNDALNVGFYQNSWSSATQPKGVWLEGVYAATAGIGGIKHNAALLGSDDSVLQYVNTGTAAGRGLWNVVAPAAKTTGTRRVAGFVFAGVFAGTAGGSNSLQDYEFGKIGVDGDIAQVIAHNYFHQYPITTAGPNQAATTKPAGWCYGMVRHNNATKNVNSADWKDSAAIWFAASSGVALNNPSMFVTWSTSDVTYDGVVFDGTYTNEQGDVIHSPNAPASVFKAHIRNCIALFDISGKALGTLPTAQCGANGQFEGHNNTYASNGLGVGGPAFNEADLGNSNESVAGWYDHLVLTPVGGTGGFVAQESTNNASNSHPSFVDGRFHHNAIETVFTGALGGWLTFGDSTAYPGRGGYRAVHSDTYGTVAPGANDLILGNGGAQLVNRAANLATWYRSIVGGTPDVEPANDFTLAFTEIQKMGTPSWDARFSIPAYVAYRKAQARPLNPVLRTASSVGGTIGAVAMAAVLVAPTLTLGTVTSTTADLTWSAATGGTPAFTYQVQQSTNGGGTWGNAGPSTGTLAETMTVAVGSTYQYRLIATDADGNTATSNVVTATPSAGGTDSGRDFAAVYPMVVAAAFAR